MHHGRKRRRLASTISNSSPTIRPRPTAPAGHTSRYPSHTRELATAIDSYPPPVPHDPFHDIPNFPQSYHSPTSLARSNAHEPRRQNYSNLDNPRPFDISRLVYPQDSIPLNLTSGARRGKGISDDLVEVQQNLNACVQIGRLDRASMLVRRITDICKPNVSYVREAHQRYLSGCLESIQRDPSQTKLEAMHKWLELDIRARGVPIGHSILAIMLKATLCTLVGSRLDRTLRRYIRLAQGLGIQDYHNTLTSSIFTDAEINKIFRLLPQQFDVPTEQVSEETTGEVEQTTETFKPDSELQVCMSEDSESSSSELIPAAKPVQQKGLGMEALKSSLASLSPDYLDEKNHAGDSQEKLDRQLRLEQDVLDSAIERWRTESETHSEFFAQGSSSTVPLGAQAYEWLQEMKTLLEAELGRVEELEGHNENYDEHEIMVAAPFLKLLPPEKVCAITIMQFFGVFMRDTRAVQDRYAQAPAALVRFCEAIGASLFAETQVQQIRNHRLQSLSEKPSAEHRKRLEKLLKSKKWSLRTAGEEHAKLVQEQDPAVEMNNALKVQVGATMLGIFLKVAKIKTEMVDGATGKFKTIIEPLAEQSSTWRSGKNLGILKVSSRVLGRLKKEPISSLIAKPLPMIVPPKPWKGIENGGYYKTSRSVVRLHEDSHAQKQYLRLADKQGDLEQLYAALNVLNTTPWRINKAVLKVMMNVWNSGEALGKIVPESADLVTPPKPNSDDPRILRHWINTCRDIRFTASANHSQRCFQNFQLEIARAFANTTFYTPHNCDFRGRSYPITPYFNHIGADHVRSLFVFAEGKELGEDGLFWLKIQLANTFGYDKQSLLDRVIFVDEHLAKIIDSATDPLRGERWWTHGDDPWQCLAACIELKGALDSDMPSKFVSHLPIQQDGSCNGLQHYAALGGDEIGARQVNLAPSDKPQDIYSGVADAVKKMVHEDALAGNRLARILDGSITRKLVKQPVMTNVYGVTYVGACGQVLRQLKEMLPDQRNNSDHTTGIQRLAAYLTTCIFTALSQMFSGAQAIQLWLGESGARISSAMTGEQIQRLWDHRHGHGPSLANEANKMFRGNKGDKRRNQKLEDVNLRSPIVWTTPLGLPVVQPYREPKIKRVKTNLQDITLRIKSPYDPVLKRKQLQAFPPNFIHSLDASHMMLSALKCNEAGMSFGSVHDSFWTHASDVPLLNKILRDAFVRMHKEDIIGRLKQEFEARYKDCYHWTSVRGSSPLGKKLAAFYVDEKKRTRRQMTRSTVKDKFQYDELCEEFERQRLLKSEDPAERERGEQMVTSTSIAEEVDAEQTTIYSTLDWGKRIGQEKDTGRVIPSLQDIDHIEHLPALAAPEAKDLVFDADADFDMGEMAEAEADTDITDEALFDEGTSSTSPPNDIDTQESSSQEAKKKPKSTKTKQLPADRIYFWMPIKFPEAPPKGTFDVSQLKDSEYFFS